MKQHPDLRLHVYAVWEPMLDSDRIAPTTLVLRRLSDNRVSQFWDAQHLVAKQLAQDAQSPQPKQKCCVRNGTLWDLAAVYPVGAVWDQQLPVAVMFNGAIVNVQSDISEALQKR